MSDRHHQGPYGQLKAVVLPLLKIESTEPHAPAGYDPHEFMRVERADPSYLRYRLFFWMFYALAWTMGILALSVALILVNVWLVLLVVPIVVIAAAKAAVLYVVTRLDYEMRWYVITDRSLLIREGVWSVREMTLTFANAQNVRVTQGPLQRHFGFSNVEVDTAGGGDKSDDHGTRRHKAVLRGLANPAAVRDLILDLLRRHRTTGLGDPDDRDRPGTNLTTLNPSLIQEIWAEAQAVRRAL